MSGNQPDFPGAARDRRPTEPSFGDIAESAVRKVATAIVLAAAIIGLAIYAGPDPPRYQAIMGEGKVIRIDTRTGTMIACDAERCFTMLRRGQTLDRNPNRSPLPKPAAPAPQALPAPVPAPAPAPATK